MKRISLLVLALPLACAFDKQLDPQASDTDDDGGSGGSSSGQSTTVGATSDPSVTTNDSATTAVPPDDDSGSDGSTGDFGSACGIDEAVLSIEIDALQDNALWEARGYYSTQMGIGLDFDASNDEGGFHFGGMVLMRNGELSETPGPVHSTGYVREPHGSPEHPDAWYCFDETSTFLDNDHEVTVSFEGLRRLGACPGGEPQQGTITACFGDESCGGASQLDVALTDIEYSIEMPGSISTALGDGEFLSTYTVGTTPAGGAGLLGLHATSYDMTQGMQVAPLSDVFFISPLDQPDGGAIYCAGAGSTLSYDGESGDPISASFTNITRLGSCSDEGGDTGTGHFCANFGG